MKDLLIRIRHATRLGSRKTLFSPLIHNLDLSIVGPVLNPTNDLVNMA